MAVVSHAYHLGKDQTFSFGTAIANKDVKSVTFTQETSAEAEVTTRGSDNIQEFVPVRKNTTIEVVVLDHQCSMHQHDTVTVSDPSSQTTRTGTYYVNQIGEPQEIDGVIETTISLRKYPGT
jgi:hypothetical protein